MDKIFYISVNKFTNRVDLWKAFPFPQNLLYPVKCLNPIPGDEPMVFNCYIQTFEYQSWSWSIFGPDTEENLIKLHQDSKIKRK